MTYQRKFHFISGLPRSGSTLLSAILRQNPRFQAGIISPMSRLCQSIIGQVSAGTELSGVVDEAQRERLLRGLFESYYADCQEEVIFDTNRSWTANMPTLARLFPDARLICVVRDVSWVMDSLERQFRANAFEHTRLFKTSGERSTVYSRVAALAGPTRLVGFAWTALREACYSEHAERIVIVEYERLVRQPEKVIGLLYDFFEEPVFEHDFSNVVFDAPEFDAQLGLTGLHQVHRTVAPRPRSTVLPPDLFEKYDQLAFWRTLRNSRAFRIAAPAPEGSQDASLPD